ncbi:cilia- and flagella-associated protein 43 [Macrosteles quadrilineatus]|uniref:cilia- and flagella-associated protein 43 n=1 Tax=Macrosteles quadrilineatus TaxID=74068 RepID=UPI0023E18547|nr:cilia- and flagella-associated protein 43 [Macrosteles quadrilineatus]
MEAPAPEEQLDILEFDLDTEAREAHLAVVQLLDDNLRATPEEQLDILEFDLDTEAREAHLAVVQLLDENLRAAPEEQLDILEFDLDTEVVQLLDDNLRATPEEQLDILEFDLDTEAREALLADAAAERDKTRRLLEAECRDCQRLAEVIRTNTWDTMAVKSRCIKAMLGDFSVENYGLQPQPPTQEVDLIWECEARKLSLEMSQGDHFEPWFPFPEEAKAIGITQSVSSPKVDKEDAGEVEKENPYLFFGSSSYQFVEISPLHCSQFEISTSFNSVSEIVMLQKVCEDLRSYFNKLFDEMFVAKEREMLFLADRNSRLRTILSELLVTCNAPMDVAEPVDAEWSQEEKTERIVIIEDNEVPETPYISPSEQDLLDKKAAEEERIRQLLAADNFRELALIDMMDGMLEVRWEDQLKKEIPKPKCLLEKKPEDYSEVDLKAIKDYEEKCRVLASERERYRKMLEIEYKKVENTIQESLARFDSSLFELFQRRLKVDAAMNHEQLKILRIYQLNDDRIRREIQEREIVQNMAQTERETEFAHKQVTLMQEATNECRSNYETLVYKDKALGKRFKQEFINTPASPAIIEQLVKYFRRRPKLQQRATQYPTLLLELARCVVESDNTSFMPPEFHEFLSAVEALDSPVSAPPFDETVWATLVRVRRAKIESELKVRAYALELKEAEYTLSVVMKQMKAAREQANAHVAELRAAKEEKIRLSRDLQVQLVMKQGLVEAPLTGHISDFQHAVLINPKIVENINQHVRAAGAKKLEAMKQVTKYHRINKYKEWEFRKMKMECEDLEDKLNNIESIKVTLEVKQYLKEKDKPPKEKETQDEDSMFLKQTEENYKGAVKGLTEEIKSVKAKIAQLKQLNAKADRSILDLKCDVSEQQFERDLELEQTLSDASRRRMAMIVKRSKLVSKIQQVHNENLVLQTELELLRLRTYPTLKYKAAI